MPTSSTARIFYSQQVYFTPSQDHRRTCGSAILSHTYVGRSTYSRTSTYVSPCRTPPEVQIPTLDGTRASYHSQPDSEYACNAILDMYVFVLYNRRRANELGTGTPPPVHQHIARPRRFAKTKTRLQEAASIVEISRATHGGRSDRRRSPSDGGGGGGGGGGGSSLCRCIQRKQYAAVRWPLRLITQWRRRWRRRLPTTTTEPPRW